MKFKNWLRSKLDGPVYLDCYTSNADAYKYAKIEPAARFYPKWWKKLKNKYSVIDPSNPQLEMRESGTMRSCAGFTDLFKSALCIPLWSDLRLTVGPIGTDFYKWLYADGRSRAGVHGQAQRGDFMPDSEYQHFKLVTPWRIKCEEDVKFLLFDPTWTGDANNGVITPPGVLEFKYQAAANVNILVARDLESPRVVDLKYGTPLAFLAPLTERRVVLRYHLISTEEFERLPKGALTFVNAYNTTKKKEQEQCPMKTK